MLGANSINALFLRTKMILKGKINVRVFQGRIFPFLLDFRWVISGLFCALINNKIF
jgi:hypothetical protein